MKYFGNEPHEAARYDAALARYERAAVRVQVSLNMLNIGQACIIAARADADHADGAHEVRGGTMTVGQFVLVNTYLMQLYQPLGFLGMVYMTIKQGMVDMEQMFRLLEVEREITDRPDAKALAAHLSDGPAGEVRFEDVHFGYQADREILKGIDFTVPAGAQAGHRRADRRGQVHHQPAARLGAGERPAHQLRGGDGALRGGGGVETHSLSTCAIVQAQAPHFWYWNVFRTGVVPFVVFFVAITASTAPPSTC